MSQFPCQAAVLHQTTEYIYTLKQDRNKLLGQNAMLKQLLSSSDGSKEVVLPYSCKRARTEIEDKLQKLENFIGEDQSLFIREIKRDIIELVSQLDRERRLRMILEEQNRALERQLYPDCQVFNFDNYRPTTGCSQIASHFSDSATGVANCPNLYNSNNLDAMVEAIRRIEGDKTFDQKSY
ncbi:Transcription factor AP-4 [Trichoplax sp. H2]|nr:Transcription factor AP-4 [Trichoplax sp. H2]|eukprot:RDD41053.1 Transcription factor AP-4 [Trichoplax sp. H2]